MATTVPIPAHFAHQECANAILTLRETLRLTQRQLADKLGVGLHLVDSWENAKFLPMTINMSKLETLAARHNAHVLTAKFRDLRQQHTDAHKAQNTATPHTEHQARNSGRESAFIEVIHLIDEKVAQIRSHPSLFDARLARGITIAELVAHELEMTKAEIRNLPASARRTIERQHVRHHVPNKSRQQHA